MVFVFWVIAGLLIAAALLFVLPPLLGRADTAGPNQNETNRALYQQRLAELERDVENDALTPAQFESARADLDRELLSDWTDTPARPSSSPRTYWAAWIVGMALPILAVGIYARLNTGLKMLSGEANSMVSAGDEQPPLEKLEELIEARLAQKPNDRTGWIMLARVDTLLGRYAAASRAYARADHLAAFKDARLLAAYAQTLAFANGQQFAGRPTMLLNKALKLQPENLEALWLAGWAAFQRKDFDQAADLWEKLDTLMPAEHRQVFKELPQVIAQAKRLSGISSAELSKNMPVPPGSRKAGTTSTKAKAALPALLHVSVQLVPKLMDRAASGDTVFVYAQALDGPRMPLALARGTVAELPLQVKLDDSMAMAPMFKLSDEERVKVTARISKTGNAMPQSGDLFGESAPIPTRGAAPVAITIDKIVP